LFFVFPLIFWVLWFIYDWQGVSSFAMLGALPYTENHLLFQSLCLERKKEECVKSADGMELLRRMMMAYGGMFPCLILLLFHGIHSHWMWHDAFFLWNGIELNGLLAFPPALLLPLCVLLGPQLHLLVMCESKVGTLVVLWNKLW
jgi:hypothetical protein